MSKRVPQLEMSTVVRKRDAKDDCGRGDPGGSAGKHASDLLSFYCKYLLNKDRGRTPSNVTIMTTGIGP